MSNDPAIREEYLRKRAEERYTGVPMELRYHDKGSMLWFYRPERYFPSWRGLIPFSIGHDGYARRTVVIGWTFSGRIVIALGYCGKQDCYVDAVEGIRGESYG